MTRTQTFLVTTAIAFTLPLAAIAQNATPPGVVGTSGPTAYGANNSTTMTKAEMKQGAPQGGYYAPMPRQAQGVYPPMNQAQAVSMGPNMAPMPDQCGPMNAPAITDEYGRKYNCRGDRIR